jgi:hypothetical protein
MDMNKVFGNVGIAETTAIMSDFKVDFAGTVYSRVINTSGNILSFRPLLSRDMWKHDLFEITVSKYFTLTQGSACSSNKQTNINNHFNGTHTDPYILDCAWTPKVISPALTS